MSKLQEFKDAAKASAFAANRLLFSWLSDDETRAELYAELRDANGVLEFQSGADIKTHTWLDQPQSKFRQQVVLLAARKEIEAALEGKGYDNTPYQMLGSGTFMLGLDADQAKVQRDFALGYFRQVDAYLPALAHAAFLAAAALPLKQREFDLADLAEQAAVRFVAFLYGFEQGDHVRIEEAMRKAYRGLNYVILGRHFLSKPGTVDEASRAMGNLLTRVAELIDVYGAAVSREQRDLRQRLQLEQDDLRAFQDDGGGNGPLSDFKPILQRVAERLGNDKATRELSAAELAVTVVGLIAGTIGNIQASVCTVINEFFDPAHGPAGLLEKARRLAGESYLGDPDYKDPVPELEAWIWEALRLNPPAAFLPRLKTDDKMVVILAMGSATRANGGEAFRYKPPAEPDPLIFGDGGAHQCVGKFVAMPVVKRIVRDVLALPGLAQTLDPRTGEWRRLEKDWGFYCTSYRLEYDRFAALKQSPLIVIMKVKQPIAEHAEKLKMVIKHGAPRIEKNLRDSGHVHFASFIFLENDTKLALYTVYDRDFDAYIEYFARQVGPLFDRIFEHIEDPPPMPVNEYPKDFVEKIRRYNNPPAAGYFFSAYPTLDVSAITGRSTEEG